MYIYVCMHGCMMGMYACMCIRVYMGVNVCVHGCAVNACVCDLYTLGVSVKCICVWCYD